MGLRTLMILLGVVFLFSFPLVVSAQECDDYVCENGTLLSGECCPRTGFSCQFECRTGEPLAKFEWNDTSESYDCVEDCGGLCANITVSGNATNVTWSADSTIFVEEIYAKNGTESGKKVCGYLTPDIPSPFENTDIFCGTVNPKDISHLTFCGNFTGDICDCEEWCESFNGWYDTGNTRWNESDDPCIEIEEKEQENRTYYYHEGECTYDVEEKTQWISTGNTRDIPHCGEQVPLLTPAGLAALVGLLTVAAAVMIRKR